MEFKRLTSACLTILFRNLINILFDELLVFGVTDEVFVAVVGTVDDIRVAAAGNVLLVVVFDWRVAWDVDREFFDDCCCDIWELVFERLTVYWFGWGVFVGIDRFELVYNKKDKEQVFQNIKFYQWLFSCC